MVSRTGAGKAAHAGNSWGVPVAGHKLPPVSAPPPSLGRSTPATPAAPQGPSFRGTPTTPPLPSTPLPAGSHGSTSLPSCLASNAFTQLRNKSSLLVCAFWLLLSRDTGTRFLASHFSIGLHLWLPRCGSLSDSNSYTLRHWWPYRGFKKNFF